MSDSIGNSADEITPEALDSLRLPAAFDETVYETALDIDALLGRDEGSAEELGQLLNTHRGAIASRLKFPFRPVSLDIAALRWPSYLFIPGNANPLDYWFSPAPDDHRYALQWTLPATATPNRASAQEGTLFSYSNLDSQRPGSSQSSESGIGIFYRPSMSLGVVEFEPHVDCEGVLRTLLEFSSQLAAGYVEVRAQLLLGAWQPIPGGFDLLNIKSFEVATSERRNQSHGPEYKSFTKSFAGPGLSAPFLVQGGRTYLFGVVSRITVISTLIKNNGEPLPPISNTELRAWGTISCRIPQMHVLTKQVNIP